MTATTWIRRVVATMLLTTAVTMVPARAIAGPIDPLPSRAPNVASMGRPLHFEPNRGQTNDRVKFLARGTGYGVFLTPGEVVLALSTRHGKTDPPAVLRLTLPGSEPSPEITGRDPLPGRVHYLKGRDPSEWRTDIPTYGRVAYRGVYPGVDLVFYGHQGRLEFDFVLAPGVDPNVLRLAVDGADRVTLDGEGHLLLKTAGGEIRLQKPQVYQEMGAERREISGEFVVEGRQIAFRIGVHDPLRPLVIDPVLVYSTYFGGGFGEGAESIVVDRSGSAYIVGSTGSSDLPTTGGIQPAPGSALPDAFVSKLSPDGSALVYSTYLGGNNLDTGTGIAVDADGNAYVTGWTQSADFPVVNPAQPRLYGDGVIPSCRPRCVLFNAFVAKINASGSALVYSTFLGGHENTLAAAIAVDAAGNAYVTGTGGTDLGATVHFHPTTTGGAFVAKYSPTGARMYLSDFGLGSPALGVAVDAAGSAYLVGHTAQSDFPVTAGAFQTTLAGDADAFVAKLNAAGSALVYSSYLGGSGRDMGSAIAVDRASQAYVLGDTNSVDFPVLNAAQPSHGGGGGDVFITKLNATGSALVYSTYLGGTGTDSSVGGDGGDGSGGIAVDSAGRASVTGYTSSPDFPLVKPFQNTLATTNCGTSGLDCFDVFVATLDASGSTLLYSSYFGGNRFDRGNGIAVDAIGDLYVGGETQSADFPTAHALQPNFAGLSDAFVLRLSERLAGCSDGNTVIGLTSAMPATVAPGQTETIQTQICSSAPGSDVVVDLEIYNAGGARVAQRIFSGQQFTPEEFKSYVWPYAVPASLPAGLYTVKVGVFAGDWSSLYSWDNQAATFTVGSSAGCTGGFTTGPTSAAPSPVTPGQTETIQTSICSGSAVSHVLVDLEIYNSSGAKVAQRVFADQSFAAGETKPYEWLYAVPPSLPAGFYTVKFGIFSADWTTLYAWDNQAATFTVGSSVGCTGGFTTGPTSAMPNPVARGHTETIQTQVCSGSGATNVLIDLEIYDSSGTKVAQTIFAGQNFIPGESKSYTWPYAVPASLPAGLYTVKVGVFSSTWSILYTWNNQAATFTVQ